MTLSEVYQADAAFAGFERPESNYFKLPNSWTDITASMETWAEHKVVEYVLRHTWGYQEYGQHKRITLDEFMHGRKLADGGRMDKGTGMGKKAIIDGLRAAVRQGYLTEETDGSDPARVRKYYGLRMDTRGSESVPLVFDDRTPDVRTAYPRGSESVHRTEKDTFERHSQKDRGATAPRTRARPTSGRTPPGTGKYDPCPTCLVSPCECPR